MTSTLKLPSTVHIQLGRSGKLAASVSHGIVRAAATGGCRA
jgi:hypothetical protein